MGIPGVRDGQLSDRTVGQPDGDPVFRPEFGFMVGTFKMRRKDLDAVNYQNVPCLMFHVPLEMRGNYKPEKLANFDPENLDYRTDNNGYRLCDSETKRRATGCNRRASNRQPYCETHGARLHPLDKVRKDPRDPTKMSRMELLIEGYIDIEDLSDDELSGNLAAGGPKQMIKMPKEVYKKILDRHFSRANEMLQEGLLPAIACLTDIMSNQHDLYEAQDRTKAAIYLIERVMGKTPQVVQVGPTEGQEPWQVIVANITQNTRAESRAARGIIDAQFEDLGEIEEPAPGEGHHPALHTDVRRVPVKDIRPKPVQEASDERAREAVQARKKVVKKVARRRAKGDDG